MKEKTFADRAIHFNEQLNFKGQLPKGVQVMNPFRINKNALEVSSAFYRKYYHDNNLRHIILGINPGRFGAGLTGVPFTDPKRLWEQCRLPIEGKPIHEPSATFVYDMINAYGGVNAFYSKFYINSVCPLGFTIINEKDKEVNYNYYDSKPLIEATRIFILESLHKLVALGVHTDVAFCLGTGKNEWFLNQLNNQFGFFKEIVALEHPRYIMQYKAKNKQSYIDKYLKTLAALGN